MKVAPPERKQNVPGAFRRTLFYLALQTCGIIPPLSLGTYCRKMRVTCIHFIQVTFTHFISPIKRRHHRRHILYWTTGVYRRLVCFDR